MTVALVSILALVAAAFGYFAGYYRGLALDRLTEIAYLKKELAEATDRLLASHKDGYYIPERGVEASQYHVDPLQDETQMWLSQWENRDYRAQMEADIRRLVRDGMDEESAVLALEAQHSEA